MNKEKIKVDFKLEDIPMIIKTMEQLQQENKQLKEEIKKYQKELEKADSITQSCIFQGKKESGISFRNCLNKMTDYKTRIDKAIELEEEIMYLANKVAITTQNVEVKAVRDRLEDIFEILKGE